ncbi:MAG: substrate-binding domain-containing protein [Lachnospiraceae bacterium]|nr:substrate-binding domain-containing protein [Robinsoniella sp.]MDY3767882.1 substrate-binding domain-containing protein [Lachnospiraceae bacterium]
MKRMGTVWLTSLILILSILFLLRTEKVDTEIPEKRITFISPMASAGYWEIIATGIMDSGKENEISTKFIGFTELNQELQIQYIRSAILSGVDGIITAGLENSEEMFEVIQEAKEADIPLILVDSDLPDSGRICYVGTDNYMAGKMAGKDMVEACGGSGNILCLVSYEEIENQKQRMAGFRDIMKENDNMKIVDVIEGESNELYLGKKVISFLEDHPEVNAVFCAEGYGVEVMSRLLEEFPDRYGQLKIIAFDIDNKRVEDTVQEGMIYSCIQQDPREMGYQAGNILSDYIWNEEREFQDQYTQAISIKQDNINEKMDYSSGEIKWHVYEEN